MAKRLIHTSNIVEYHLDTHEGVEMISRYSLFQRLVADELTEDKAQILAEPVKDLSHNRVNWYSELQGQVVPFEDLPPDDQRYAIDVVADRAADLEALSQKFLASNSRNRKLAGELFANILSRAGKRNIFMVGDRPVVVGWGLTSIKEVPAQDAMFIANLLRERKTKPKVNESKEPDKTPDLPPEPEPPSPEPEPPAAEPKDEKKTRAPLKSIPTKKITVEVEKSRLSCLPFLLLLLFGLILWWLFWRTEPYRAIDPDGPEPVKGSELVIPEGAMERGDFSFMEGCWVSSSDSLKSLETGLPVEVKYCFDRAGEAVATLDEMNDQGQFIQTCRGQAKASYEDGELVITERTARECPNGNSYFKAILRCRPKSSTAASKGVDCSITQDSMEEKVQTDFFRTNN
ncbi:MAG: hypothetical protein LBI10_10190 [Deltaproteobacteria bacterium]|jgi:hypothetical protein|nr:hypothetical protein [Deltaproteobacteria bacterium]